MKNYILQGFPLPVDAVQLGTFVQNVQDPIQEFFDLASTEPQLVPDVVKSPVINYASYINNAGSASLKAILTEYLTASVSGAAEQSTHLAAVRAMHYQVRNSDSWFEKVCSTNSAREWLEKKFGGGKKIYLLVGFKTMFDSRLVSQDSQSKNAQTTAKMPGDAMTGLPMGLDAGVSGAMKRSAKAFLTFNAPGERIWALQYRRIDFNFFSSRKVDNAFLEGGPRWHIISERGADDDEDIIEAVVEDDLHLPSDLDTAASGEETFVLLAKTV